MADAPFVATIQSRDGSNELVLHGRTRADGTFSRQIGDRLNLKPGDFLLLLCSYPTGDLLQVTNSAA